jgi:hypothetical protein
VNLVSVGEPTRDFGEAMGFAARIDGGVSEREAAELVVEALGYMLLGAGYLDPRPALDELRRDLGLPDAPDAWLRTMDSA